MNNGLTFRMNQANCKRYMPHLLEHIRAGRIEAQGVISHRFSPRRRGGGVRLLRSQARALHRDGRGPATSATRCHVAQPKAASHPKVTSRRGPRPARQARLPFVVSGSRTTAVCRSPTKSKALRSAKWTRRPAAVWSAQTVTSQLEVDECARRCGRRRAGTLLTCSFCAVPWTAAPLTAALIARPRETRAVDGIAIC
jgi:Protein of unknown function (DUF1360)